MTCGICGNSENNKLFKVQEKQYCFKEWFSYFQCAACDCMQILNVPENISKYYPGNYYSFRPEAQLFKRQSFFQKVQSDYLIYGKSKLIGRLFTLKYQPPHLFSWLKNLHIDRDDSILDIGSGSGGDLKKLYQLGYKNLMGIDPFIPEDIVFTDDFLIYKKGPMQLSNDKKFDCIMMHHSFEHMEHQLPVLKKIKQLLKPRGKVLIRIPLFSQVLWDTYGANVVSLDAPRHFFIHSIKSMNILCSEAGLKIDKTIYDADEFSLWASEEYSKDICLSDSHSYAENRKKSIFSKKDIKGFKKKIKKLNAREQSDSAAFYISALSDT